MATGGYALWWMMYQGYHFCSSSRTRTTQQLTLKSMWKWSTHSNRGVKVQQMHSNGGGEFINKNLNKFLKSKGVK
jgi:hypothetical protein